jgi:hypothetical protein
MVHIRKIESEFQLEKHNGPDYFLSVRVLAIFIVNSLLGLSTACAYHVGLSDRVLPGGYKQIAVPIFKNKTDEVGIEAYFTDAMIRRLNRSQAAQVTDKASAPLTMEGTIVEIKTERGAGVVSQSEIPRLPEGTVLTSEYRLIVLAKLSLKRKSDDKVIWETSVSSEKVYSAPRIGTPVVNSANALYNHSARHDTIAQLAEEMMKEAHDRMTENF